MYDLHPIIVLAPSLHINAVRIHLCVDASSSTIEHASCRHSLISSSTEELETRCGWGEILRRDLQAHKGHTCEGSSTLFEPIYIQKYT